jgi:DNA invertase Pin-like site-specific DNA recombinase
VAFRLRIRPFAKGRRLTAVPYLIGYARVSKGDDQSNAAQRRALDAAGCKRVFEETASGGRWDRPKLLEMIGQLRDGDVVVVWKLDRLSRSLKDMLHVMERIEIAGAGFRSLTEAIDTTTAAGRMMMQMVGSFAEFERAMIRERTSAGLAQARAEGRIGGRRCKLNEKQRREIAESVASGRKSGAGDGAPLRRQRTNRLTHRRRVPAGHGSRIDIADCPPGGRLKWAAKPLKA